MYALLIFLFVLICFVLTVVILMQSGYRGGGLSTAFGGTGSTGAIFGGRGAAPFLSKLTAVLASVFVILCIILSLKTPKVSVKAETEALKQMRKRAEESAQAKALSPLPLFGEKQTKSDTLAK